MRARFVRFWAELSESFWLVPAGMAIMAVGFAVSAVALDRSLPLTLSGSVWVWSGGADGARSLLSTIASSMITVAGTVFSITIAALTLASQQFGPRLLRNFTADRGNQVVLGTFIATFLYCLMVLRTVRSQNEGPFVPNVAVSFGVVLACASLGVLIFFIHHVASSIQAESLLAGVARDLNADLERLAPPAHRPAVAVDAGLEPNGPPSTEIAATTSGYIQVVDRDRLFAVADANGLLIELRHRPGDFVSAGESLLYVWTQNPGEVPDLEPALRGAINCGPRRTPLDDVRYGVRQLTEIGARALSPGINDPFTANGCVDWLTDTLTRLTDREPPTGVHRNHDGAARLLEHPVSFAEMLHLGLEPIRTYGASSGLVVVHILRSLARLGARATRAQHRRAILAEAQLTYRAGQATLPTEHDRAEAAKAFAAVRHALGSTTPEHAVEILPLAGVPV